MTLVKGGPPAKVIFPRNRGTGTAKFAGVAPLMTVQLIPIRGAVPAKVVPSAKGRHPEGKSAYFWTFSKRGEGANRIKKCWGCFFGAFFWTFSKEGRVNPFQKFWEVFM